jgi:erythronate-4-phosphate dehydrogenase
MFINASRGAVVHERALREYRSKLGPVVLDVWESEPSVDVSTLLSTNTATPHIAGYSYDGKLNGTIMVYNALCRFLKVQPDQNVFKQIPVELRDIDVFGAKNEVAAAVLAAYPIENDDRAFRKTGSLEKNARGIQFDLLRKQYWHRLEFRHFRVIGARKQVSMLRRLGFCIA